MKDYIINYNDCKTVTVTAIDADHARASLKKVMPSITINSTIKVPKNASQNKSKIRKTL